MPDKNGTGKERPIGTEKDRNVRVGSILVRITFLSMVGPKVDALPELEDLAAAIKFIDDTGGGEPFTPTELASSALFIGYVAGIQNWFGRQEGEE